MKIKHGALVHNFLLSTRKSTSPQSKFNYSDSRAENCICIYITHTITHWKPGFIGHFSKMYQPKKTDAFYYSLLFMRYLHYYPSKANEKSWKLYRSISFFVRILNSFVWIECVLHFSMALKGKTKKTLKLKLRT